MLKPKKILVPTDFSRNSDVALRQAFDIAVDYGSEVHILHVVEDKIRFAMDEAYDNDVTPTTISRIEHNLQRAAKSKIQKQIDSVAKNNSLKIVQEVLIGKPQEVIIDYQQEKKIDLVVISSLGHTGLARYFIGSVARIVLKGATCPVLLTK